MATIADLDELALALPETTKELSDDGRPAYKANGKLFVLHRSRRPDAVDPRRASGMDDVLIFRVPDLDVKELMLADDRREELEDLVMEAWLTGAKNRGPASSSYTRARNVHRAKAAAEQSPKR